MRSAPRAPAVASTDACSVTAPPPPLTTPHRAASALAAATSASGCPDAADAAVVADATSADAGGGAAGGCRRRRGGSGARVVAVASSKICRGSAAASPASAASAATASAADGRAAAASAQHASISARSGGGAAVGRFGRRPSETIAAVSSSWLYRASRMVCSFTFSFSASAYGTAWCRDLAGEDAERVDVARADVRRTASARRAQQLGRHVRQRAHHKLLEEAAARPADQRDDPGVDRRLELGRVEVGEDARAALVDEDVVRLHVAVQHAARVQVRDRGGDVAGERRHRRRREPPARRAEQREERAARVERQHERVRRRAPHHAEHARSTLACPAHACRSSSSFSKRGRWLAVVILVRLTTTCAPSRVAT